MLVAIKLHCRIKYEILVKADIYSSAGFAPAMKGVPQILFNEKFRWDELTYIYIWQFLGKYQ